MSDTPGAPRFDDRARRALYERRVVVLDGPLDDDNGTLLASQLLALAAEDRRADIALWIHSPGGSVPSMLAIRDVMRLVPCDVATLALGLAVQRRAVPAVLGRARASGVASARAHPDAPGLGRHRRHGRRGRAAGGRPAATRATRCSA